MGGKWNWTLGDAFETKESAEKFKKSLIEHGHERKFYKLPVTLSYNEKDVMAKRKNEINVDDLMGDLIRIIWKAAYVTEKDGYDI